MTGETVTYSLEAVLTRIEGKLDKIDERLQKVELGLATLTEKVEGIDKRLEKVEGTQKNRVWTLIILLGGAIATAAWRSFFSVNP
jgi:prefoldin subunit 5